MEGKNLTNIEHRFLWPFKSLQELSTFAAIVYEEYKY